MLIALTVFKDLMKSIRDDLTLLPMESAKTVEKSCKLLFFAFSTCSKMIKVILVPCFLV